jgi:hypothetical protein
MISDFYTTEFSIKRAAWTEDGEGNPYSEEQVVVSFNGHIQQAQAELATNLGLSLTKAFMVWCPIGTNVKEGDILDTTEASYSVRAVQDFNNGDNKHMELIVELDEIHGS